MTVDIFAAAEEAQRASCEGGSNDTQVLLVGAKQARSRLPIAPKRRTAQPTNHALPATLRPLRQPPTAALIAHLQTMLTSLHCRPASRL